MNLSEDDILGYLYEYFRYIILRPDQLPIVQNILKKRDVLVCKETGFGKSLCYQLAGVMNEGVVMVISSSQSRIDKKCNELEKFKNIKCSFLDRDIVNNEKDSRLDLRNVLIKKNKVLEDLKNIDGSGLKFLYINFEYFAQSNRLKQILKEVYDKKQLQSIVIEDINFDHGPCCQTIPLQELYSVLCTIRSSFFRVPILCFTKPLPKLKLTELQEALHLRDPYVLNEPSIREDLIFKVMYTEEKVPIAQLAEFVKKSYCNKSGIVYFSNEQDCMSFCKELDNHGIKNCFFDSELTDSNRAWLKWISSDGIVVVCVSGCGFDLPLHRVEFVLHTNIPKCLDVYYQETGKIKIESAKRGEDEDDKIMGECILLYSNKDYDHNLTLVKEKYEDSMEQADPDLERKIAAKTNDDRRAMLNVIVYAENISVCRQVFLLKYFNEDSLVSPCGVCDVCTIMENSFVIDVADSLRKILMTIWAINRHQKANLNKEKVFYASIDDVIGLLRGNVKRCLASSWVTKEWFFGSFGSWDLQILYRFIFTLLSNKFASVNLVLNENSEVAQNLIITTKGQEFVKHNNEFHIAFARKDIHFTNWFNKEWIKKQFKNDLESAILYNSLHNNEPIPNCYHSYLWSLYELIPDTWNKFRGIRNNYIQNHICKLDKDLFTVCATYHRILRSLNHGMDESTGETPSQNSSNNESRS